MKNTVQMISGTKNASFCRVRLPQGLACEANGSNYITNSGKSKGHLYEDFVIFCHQEGVMQS